MSSYEIVFNQKPKKPNYLDLNSTTDETGNCKPSETSICKEQRIHSHLEDYFSHPKLRKLEAGIFAKWLLDREKHF